MFTKYEMFYVREFNSFLIDILYIYMCVCVYICKYRK
jgi:hypothetical protein